MNPINDKKFSHNCSNGTTFTADHCDFRDGVKVEGKPDCPARFASDVAEMVAFHTSNIHPQLNGFQGYDAFQFEIVEPEIFGEDLIGKIVQFTDQIEDLELELDTGMKATILKVGQKDFDGIFKVTFATNSFIEHNNSKMKPNYYDKNGNPTMTAREHGSWPENEVHEIYFDEETGLSPYFKILNKDSVDLRICDKGDKLISNHGEVLTYVKYEPQNHFRHRVEYADGSSGSRSDDGFVMDSVEKRLETDHNIVKIIKNS